jgi:hypothetical protein
MNVALCSGLGPVAGSCEYGDEPLGFGTTKLIFITSKYVSVKENGQYVHIRIAFETSNPTSLTSQNSYAGITSESVLRLSY